MDSQYILPKIYKNTKIGFFYGILPLYMTIYILRSNIKACFDD